MFDFSEFIQNLNSGTTDDNLYYAVLCVWIMCWIAGLGSGLVIDLLVSFFSSSVSVKEE